MEVLAERARVGVAEARVRKPGTRDEFSVLLTGPQQGKLISSPSNVALIQ